MFCYKDRQGQALENMHRYTQDPNIKTWCREQFRALRDEARLHTQNMNWMGSSIKLARHCTRCADRQVHLLKSCVTEVVRAFSLSVKRRRTDDGGHMDEVVFMHRAVDELMAFLETTDATPMQQRIDALVKLASAMSFTGDETRLAVEKFHTFVQRNQPAEQ
ncbi:hypothetical protein BGZ63DRAFT_394710 [Mariannaea sp. PMI_226]|nr:hypothetical protein BGZ63DRAFT_394710 [Mariannaea sp. PMI_226]